MQPMMFKMQPMMFQMQPKMSSIIVQRLLVSLPYGLSILNTNCEIAVRGEIWPSDHIGGENENGQAEVGTGKPLMKE